MTQTTSGSAKATSIETNDIAPISAGERHGKAWHLFTVWSSPNLEFATVFIGFLAVIAFGLNVWQAIAAILVGNTLAAVTHGILSTWGPKKGLPQMVLGRSAFGFLGNLLPAGLSTLVAGIGWFAVNSTSGAFALQALFSKLTGTDFSIEISLLIVVLAQIGVAFVGHNLIQKFERYAFYYLVVVFGIGAVLVLGQGNYTVTADHSAFNLVGFTLTAAAAYGYTAGWTAFASDYTRYLPANTNSRSIGLAAGSGNWFATTLLMSVGAVAWTVASADGNPTTNFTNLFHNDLLAALTLLGIAVGSIGANVLNVYSGAMSFLAMGFKLGYKARRALMTALAGVVGSITAYAAIKGDFVGKFEGFLLVVSYWVAPWIAIVVTDWFLRGRKLSENVLDHKRENYAGPVAFVIAMVVSIVLFCNQLAYTGPLASAWGVGDITPLVGFILASALYAVLGGHKKD